MDWKFAKKWLIRMAWILPTIRSSTQLQEEFPFMLLVVRPHLPKGLILEMVPITTQIDTRRDRSLIRTACTWCILRAFKKDPGPLLYLLQLPLLVRERTIGELEALETLSTWMSPPSSIGRGGRRSLVLPLTSFFRKEFIQTS